MDKRKKTNLSKSENYRKKNDKSCEKKFVLNQDEKLQNVYEKENQLNNIQKCGVPSGNNEIIERLKNLTKKFESNELLFKICLKIYEDLYSGLKILTVNDLPSGFKKNPKYLTSCVVYYALRDVD